MRLISLNTWGLRVHKPLIEFVVRERATTDIFCFQEVYHTTSDQIVGGSHPQPRFDSLAQLSAALGDKYNSFHTAGSTGSNQDLRVDFHLEYGNATFANRSLTLLEQSEVFVYQTSDDRLTHPLFDQPRAVQISQFDDFTVINFHGLWKRDTFKQDTPSRIEQAKRLRQVIDRYPKRLILCGDFNLLPDNESMAIIKEGLRDLIHEYGVTSTRSSFYDKPIGFADYILIRPEIEVKEFRVMPDEVSDHLALLLEFE